MFRHGWEKTLSGIVLLLILVVAVLFGEVFTREIVVEIAILAILAISLDIIAGYGGMISLCHGAIFGLGAYAYALAAIYGAPLWVGVISGLAVAGLFGLLVGFMTAATGGIFFIMATLAFGQMAYVVVFESPFFGGDDGLPIPARLDLSAVGINLNDPIVFACFCLAVLVLCYVAAAILLRASFGRTLCGIHANAARCRVLGIGTHFHKAVAFGFSAMWAGAAGVLVAMHTQFVSPDLLEWTVSGEILIVVILGGLGTLIGPVWGAALFIWMKHSLGDYTSYWHLVMGLMLIAVVFAGGRGIFGEFEAMLARRGWYRGRA